MSSDRSDVYYALSELFGYDDPTPEEIIEHVKQMREKCIELCVLAHRASSCINAVVHKASDFERIMGKDAVETLVNVRAHKDAKK